MKIIVTLSGGFLSFVVFFATAAFAQHPSAVNEIISAEKAFSRYSVAHSTRDAFVQYMADDGILFRAQEPVNGKKLWESRTADASLLQWWPQYADVSSDGRLGYTTGPWIGKRNRDEPAPGAYGYYSSVWEKQTSGEWKVVVDISIPLPEGLVSGDTTVKIPEPVKKTKRGRTEDILTILQTDSLYNAELSIAKRTFLTERFAMDSRIHRREQWPFTSPHEFSKIHESVSSVKFQCLSRNLGQYPDLAYSYGKATLIDLQGQEKLCKYLRVWKWMDGKWKIVLDVLG